MIFIEIPTSEVWFVLRDSTLHASFIHLGHYKAFRFRHSLVALIFFLNQDREEIDLPKHLEKQKKKNPPIIISLFVGVEEGVPWHLHFFNTNFTCNILHCRFNYIRNIIYNEWNNCIIIFKRTMHKFTQ